MAGGTACATATSWPVLSRMLSRPQEGTVGGTVDSSSAALQVWSGFQSLEVESRRCRDWTKSRGDWEWADQARYEWRTAGGGGQRKWDFGASTSPKDGSWTPATSCDSCERFLLGLLWVANFRWAWAGAGGLESR